MHGPDPANPHPMEGFPQVCYIRNVVTNPNIVVGDYTYYDAPTAPSISNSATCCTTTPSSATSCASASSAR